MTLKETKDSNRFSVLRTTNPCVGKCTTTFDEVCKGCGRTWKEVRDWITYTDEEKDKILKRINNEN